MTLVGGVDKLLSLSSKKRFGYSQDCGTAFCGFILCGWNPDWAGIYQRKKTLKGWQISKMSFYWPTNPQTVPQQANRAKFASAVSAYQALDPTQKTDYDRRAYKLRIPAYSLFIREYFRSH